MPNGKPFWGGTYFRKEDCVKQILEIADVYKNEPKKALDFADRLTLGIKQVENIGLNTQEAIFKQYDLDKMVFTWSEDFDNVEGGFSIL